MCLRQWNDISGLLFLLGRAGERRRDSKPNLIVGYPADGRGALGCTASRRDPCQILADRSRLRRGNGGLSDGRARLFRSFWGVSRKLRYNSRVICTEAEHLIQSGRKLACGEQRDCRSYRCGDDEATHGGEPPESLWSSRLSWELR